MLTAILMALQAAVSPPIDGRLLPSGDSCYTASTADGTPVGTVLRRVEKSGADRLTITVVARFNGGPLTRSRLEVTRADLRPLSTREETDGKVSLLVRYRGRKAVGKVYADGGKAATSTVSLDGAAWDDDILDFLVTTLPLAVGARFDSPVFRFERGPARSGINVTGTRLVRAAGADREAWVVTSSTRSGMVLTFLVATHDRRLLGVDVGDVRSRLGGDCSGLENEGGVK